MQLPRRLAGAQCSYSDMRPRSRFHTRLYSLHAGTQAAGFQPALAMTQPRTCKLWAHEGPVVHGVGQHAHQQIQGQQLAWAGRPWRGRV